MRIASGGITHESNTFVVKPTTLEDFIQDSGGEPHFPESGIPARFAGTATIHGGYLAAAEDLGLELIPVLQATATPGGPVEDSAFFHLKNKLIKRIRDALPLDAILLDLHGAMVTESIEDAEGDIVSSVRNLVGQAVPIIMTLDLHANITPLMATQADILIGYDTYPHTDMHERGVEAVNLAMATARGLIQPTSAYRQLPLLTMPPMQCTLRQPMQNLIELIHNVECQSGILTSTLSMGFPFADIQDAGVSVLVTTNGDEALAAMQVQRIATEVWQHRMEFGAKLTPIKEVLKYVAEEANGLVVLADGSDNPGGGGPSDGTVILKTFLEENAKNAVVGILCDPETVKQAHNYGVGNNIDAVIGGKTDHLHGEPVHTQVYVKTLGDGEFIFQGPMGRGSRGHLGKTAVLVAGGTEIVVSERRHQLRDSAMLRSLGIEPLQRELIAVKSAVHFRADIGTLAERIFDADTPGVHRPDFSSYKYQNVRRPIYPLDELC